MTAITADAPRNVDFYARVLGLRMIKKTVNFDQPDVYHLYYGDELGTPGSVLTFFEFPGAAPGRHGSGMPYRIAWRVAGGAALDFWVARLDDERVAVTRTDGGSVRFEDHEGLEHELVADDAPDPPLQAAAPDIPKEHALQGFAGVRAYAADPAASAPLLEALDFAPAANDDAWELAGESAARAGPTTRRPAAARRAPARSTTSPGRLPTTTSSPATARSPPPLARGRRRSSTASTFTPCTSASRAACCSSSPRATSASTSTSRSTSSARASCCRRSTRHGARSSRRG